MQVPMKPFKEHLVLLSGLSAVALALACKPALQADGPVHPAEPESLASVEEVVAASDLPPTVEEPLQGDPMTATIHRLDNGLTVYVSTDRQQPRFNAWIAVRAGSRHDPAGSTGLAHYLEHMLFKGTDEMGTMDMEREREHVDRVQKLYADLRQAETKKEEKRILAEIDAATQAMAKVAVPNELDRIYTKLGIEGLNAFTSDEMTVYISDVPTNRLEAWATVEGERFQDAVFRLFFTELETVYEEKNLSLDSPYQRVNETLMEALFPQHPYGTQPTIGLVEHLKVPAYQDMVDYFERWYRPNNVAIALAGDIDAETALPVLQKTFGEWKPRALEPVEPGKLVPLHGRVAKEVRVEGEQTVTMAWHTVAIGHDDEPVMEVLDWLMDDGQSGLLNLELELTQKVPEVGSSATANNEAGYWEVRATAKEGQKLEDVEALIRGVVGKLTAGEFTQADIDAIVLNHEIREKQRLESNWARVAKMGRSFLQHRSWDQVLERDRRLKKVTREDVVRVAKKYLGDDYVVVFRLKGKPDLPKIVKPKITPVPIDATRESPFARRILAMEAPDLDPEWLVEGKHYVHRDLPAGPMIAAINERNDLFSLSYNFDRGYRKAPLLCHALKLLERSGAGDLPADELRKKLYALGTSVRTSCNAEGSSLDLRGVDGNLEASLQLVEKWFRNPTFDDEVVAKLLENTLSTRKDQTEDPDYLAQALSDYANFGKQSAWLLQPSNAKLQRARGKQLGKLIETFLDHQHRTLYFGPRAAKDMAEVVALGKRHRKVGERRARRYRKVRRPTTYLVHKDVAKSTIGITFPDKPLPREQRPVARLYTEYLSGNMSSLIFQEIREARGLAYYAYGYYDPGPRKKDDAGLLGRMGTQADKTAYALETLLGLVQKRAIEADRVAEAKTSLEQSYRASRVDPRWINRWVLGWDELGEKEDPRPWEREEVRKLESKDVEAFAAQFAEHPIVISVTGDGGRIDMEALKSIAPITEVEAKDLFSYGGFPAVEAGKKKDKE